MNTPYKIALVLAITTFAAATTASAQAIDNWRDSSGTVIKNGTNELCWRNSAWTAETGVEGCDGVATAQVEESAATSEYVAVEKVVLNTDAFFDFDKAVLKPEHIQALEKTAEQAKALELEVVIVTGHTDATGSDAYNLRLSQRRADAVKNYFVTRGIDVNVIRTEGKGKAEPVASNSTREGRARNRRVEVEIVGHRH